MLKVLHQRHFPAAEVRPLASERSRGKKLAYNGGIIANPNCCAIPLAMVVDAIRRRFGIRRVVVATYQSASGAGRRLVDELHEQTRAIAGGQEPSATVYPHQLAYNVVPGGWK